MRALTCVLLVITSIPLVGCTICPPGYLDDYATVGGRYQRLDPTTGRVGSAFSDPGTQEVYLDQGESTYYDQEYSEFGTPYYTPQEESGPVYGEPNSEYVPSTDLPGQSLIQPQSDPPSFEFDGSGRIQNSEVVPTPGPLQGSGSRSQP